jgi:rubrerythrin
MKEGPPATRSTAPEQERDRRPIDQLQYNWALEMDGVAMYSALAEREKNPERRTLFHKLGEFERRHAEQWARRLQALNASVPAAHDGRGHATRIAATPGGLQAIILAIEGEERRDIADYTRQLREVEDEETAAIAGSSPCPWTKARTLPSRLPRTRTTGASAVRHRTGSGPEGLAESDRPIQINGGM